MSRHAPRPTTRSETLISRRAAVIGGAGAVLGAIAISKGAWAAEPANLRSNVFNLAVDDATGGVFTLSNPSDSLGTNFVLNASKSQFAVDDSRWTGDLIFNVRAGSATTGTTMVTGLSDDIRTITRTSDSVVVTYSGTAKNAAGIRGFGVVETYALTGANRDQLSWTIKITNTSGTQLEFQDFGFPLLMNSYWNGGDQTSIYEQNVSRHSYVALDGSYIYWQRPNGYGPYLLMTPQAGTSLEFKNKARYNEGPFAEVDPAWEGVVEYYVHSKNIATARKNQAASYLPATSLTLAAGTSKTYGFTFSWADDYTGLRQGIYNSGLADLVSMPGMVIPQDIKATLAVRAQGGITSVTAESGRNTTITSQGTKNGYAVYTLAFADLGPTQVTVTYSNGRRSVLQYNSISAIETLINSRSSFIANKQQAKTTRGYNGAFLQWSMTTQKLVTWDDYPYGGWKQWMAGGSDDLGHGPAEFLSEKNVVKPVQAELTAVDYYITNFLLGYLQSRTENGARTWQVYRWYDGQDGTPSDQGVWRAYNYIHIANTYFNMYRVARAWPSFTFKYTAAQYLDMSFQTLVAMFTKIPQPTPIGDAAHELGLMGESTYPDILAALQQEGATARVTQLRQYIESKRDYLFKQKYPFASEASIDTTGFETNYTIAKMYNNRTLMDKVETASQACRGVQPLWYFYGGDNRHMGESWWNLGYEAQLGAWQQQDYLLSFSANTDRDFHEIMRQTYGAYLGGWANINSGQISSAAGNMGAAAWIFQSEKGSTANYDYIPLIDGWWGWSGEADLGFWGALRTASANVVEDPILGTYAYGGDISLASGSYTLVPRDGVRTRFAFYNLGKLNLQLERTRYTRAVVAQNLASVVLTLENVAGGAYSPTITLRNLPSGSYRLTVDGVSGSTTVSSDGATLTARPAGLTGATSVVRITRV